MSTPASCNNPEPPLISAATQERTDSHTGGLRRVDWLSTTRILLAFNVSVFITMLFHSIYIGGIEKFLNTKVAADFDSTLLQMWGSNYGPLTLQGQFWRVITTVFVHRNIGHLLGNMLFLWGLGRELDRLFDRAQTFAIFLLTGAAASVFSLWWHPLVNTAGSSSAIYGQAGVLIVVLIFARANLARRSIIAIIIWLALSTPFELLSGHLYEQTNYAGHVGGLLAGLVIGALVVLTLRLLPAEQVAQQRRYLRLATVAIVFAFAIVTQLGSKIIKEMPEGIVVITNELNHGAGEPPFSRIFLDLKGDPKLVHRLSSFLDIELESAGITITGNRKDADAVIEGEIHAESTRSALGFGVVRAQITAQSNVENMDSCETISAAEDGDFFTSSADSLSSRIRHKHPDAETVSVGPGSDMAASSKFGQDFPTALKTAGFILVESPHADIALRIQLVRQKISIQKLMAVYKMKVIGRNGALMLSESDSGVLFAKLTETPPATCPKHFASLDWLYSHDPLFYAATNLAGRLQKPMPIVSETVGGERRIF
jgi:membrane associated rhomboid family serine protease